jgi:hypothetical protein
MESTHGKTHSEKRRGGVLVVSNRIPLPRREQSQLGRVRPAVQRSSTGKDDRTGNGT